MCLKCEPNKCCVENSEFVEKISVVGVFSSWGAYIVFMIVNEIYGTAKEDREQSKYFLWDNIIP